MAREMLGLVILLFCVNLCQTLRTSILQSNRLDTARFKKYNYALPMSAIDVSYNECSQDGSCKIIKKTVHTRRPYAWNIKIEAPKSRIKRRIFGADNRQRIYYPFTQRYPFSSAVAIRSNATRCSGIAVKKDMFLTAAHCVKPVAGVSVSNIEVGVVTGREIIKWTPVKTVKFHVNWEKRKGQARFIYDYAVLQTTSKLEVQRMKIGLIGKVGGKKDILKTVRPYMFFSAFDDKRPWMVRFRSCPMKKVTDRTIYSKCDTVPETAGAGVFVNVRERGSPRGQRKIVAIDTGGIKTGPNTLKRYSSALRISRRSFAQICYWITNDYGQCGGTEI